MATVQMDPNYAQNTWKLLKGAILEIHRQNASGLSFEELYRNAYNMVLHKYGDLLYSGLRDVVDEHLRGVAESIRLNESFLQDLNKAWTAHKVSMLMIRDILMYMDRVYVPHKGDCEPVYDVGLILFRENVARHPRIREFLVKTLLEEVRKERMGEVVNRSALRSATQMLVDVGLSSTSVYTEDFETAFLESSAQFYRQESQEFVATSSVPGYLRKVEKRLREESNRVAHYFDPSTKPRITAVVERELLAAHMKGLLSNEDTGFVAMLREDQSDDLQRLYTLLARIDGGHRAMMDYLGAYIHDTASQLIDSCVSNEGGGGAKAAGAAKSDKTDKEESKETFIVPIMELKDKFNRVLRDSFSNDPAFARVLNQAFEAALNSSRHTPEYLSLYIDECLKRGLRGASEDQVELAIERSLELFRLVSEKDVFERYYKQHLARRLLLGKSVSDYAERQVIASLKKECGYQFTSRLEGMFQDMRTSADTMTAFSREPAAASLSLELSVQVLTTGFWPLAQATQCVLPPEITKACTIFSDFYLSRHNGRRITWQPNMGNADVRCCFAFPAATAPLVTLNVSTFQMVLLLLFNDRESYTFEALQAATNIEEKDLKRHLVSLMRYKVLLKTSPTPGADKKKVDVGDTLTINAQFKSKLRRVKVALGGSSRSNAPERAVTDKKVDEDRKLAIQACIVRVMKSRKTATHTQLVNEVTRLLAQRFPPKPQTIKKQIESLIERDYLERSTTERKMLSYVA